MKTKQNNFSWEILFDASKRNNVFQKICGFKKSLSIWICDLNRVFQKICGFRKAFQFEYVI